MAPLRIQFSVLPTDTRVLGQVALKTGALVRKNLVTCADTFPREGLGDSFAYAGPMCAMLWPEGA